MASVTANGIKIEYESAGDPSSPPLLLIMGLGGQLVAWDDPFVEELVKRGFYVIRHDNRDVGLSTWFDEAGVPDMAQVMVAAASGGTPDSPYLLRDMAADAAGLLDALGIASAHVLGVSMGGMIAQQFAIDYPSKLRSLVSIMSTTGERSVGNPHPEAMAALMAPPPTTRDEAIEASVKSWSVLGSPGFEFDEKRIRERAAVAFDRAFHPEGIARQLAAIIASGDRTTALGSVKAPTLVIHGEADPLVDPSGGKATAAAVPGASLWLIPGMGHDLPPELFSDIADRVAAHCLGG
jgi:pimeloyl-ACP methyl ester carboxylesterase